MWNSVKPLDWNSTYISGVKYIVAQYVFKPSVNLSYDYEIVFHDSRQSYLKWNDVIAHVFHLFFVFELSL